MSKSLPLIVNKTLESKKSTVNKQTTAMPRKKNPEQKNRADFLLIDKTNDNNLKIDDFVTLR